MGNPLRAESEVVVEGKTYRLHFTWNAAATFEDASGRALSDALMDLVRERLSAKSLRAMLWAGLQKHHPDLTITEAGDLLGAMGRKEAIRLLGMALRYYFPEIAAADEKPEGKESGGPKA